ncbi:YdeI/OmpD-associated family protein [Candidatus Peribacteria bacterium]|nr:YdeI/OmpD-associated family protein [Candidatus Peribacteria bacterium]
MNKISLLAGVVHELPDDMSEALLADEKITEAWNALTPLARNEWICWTTIVKKEETRQEHIARLLEDLKK